MDFALLPLLPTTPKVRRDCGVPVLDGVERFDIINAAILHLTGLHQIRLLQ